MVVTAHPDDPEFLAGGTVARLVREGREVTYVIMTNGSKGSSDRAITPQDLVPIRQEEQRRAARMLGVERVERHSFYVGVDSPAVAAVVRAILRL